MDTTQYDNETKAKEAFERLGRDLDLGKLKGKDNNSLAQEVINLEPLFKAEDSPLIEHYIASHQSIRAEGRSIRGVAGVVGGITTLLSAGHAVVHGFPTSNSVANGAVGVGIPGGITTGIMYLTYRRERNKIEQLQQDSVARYSSD